MGWLQDWKLAVRRARHNGGFTLAVVLTLGLCIGVNAAIFSVVDVVFLRPLPYPHPDDLAQIVVTRQAGETEARSQSFDGREWELLRDHTTLMDLAVYSGWVAGVNCGNESTALYVQQQRVGSGFFRVLGVNPAMGREFAKEDDLAGGPSVVVVSHRLWSTMFDGQPEAIGRSLWLRGEPYTVVGVMPAGFRTETPVDVWTPLRASRSGEGSGANYSIVGRVKQDRNWAQARAELDSLTGEFNRGVLSPDRSPRRLDMVTLQEGSTSEVRQPLKLLLAAVVMVFLIGCVNVGSMMLARSSGRASEMATRLALGASPLRLFRQMIVESLFVVALGGIAAVAIGTATLKGLAEFGSGMFPIIEEAALDGRTLLAAVAMVLVATLLAGVFPALRAVRVSPREAQAGARTVAGRRHFYSMGALATVQVALAVPLLVGAGLLGRTFLHLWNLNPGFDAGEVYAAKVSLQDARYTTSETAGRLLTEGAARIAAIPGVEAAAAGLSLPFERQLNLPVRFGASSVDGEKPRITNVVYVTPGYFDVLRVPLLQGREFSLSDGPNAEKVVVVNAAFVREYLPDRPALGEFLRLGGDEAYRITGVIGNIQQRPGWGDYGPMAPVPVAYVPLAQVSDGFLPLVHQWFSPAWVVRSALQQAALARHVDDAIRSLDPMLPVAFFYSMSDVKAQTLGLQRFMAFLLSLLSGLGLLLCVLGVYGLVSNSVGERTREMGIRLALGASVGQVVRTAMRPGVVWSLMGLVAGLGLSLWSQRLLRSFVHGVSSTDPLTIGGIVLLLLAAAAVASLLPALSVTRLNPADTLRAE